MTGMTGGTYFVLVAPADGNPSGGGWYILTAADDPEQAKANAVACEACHGRTVTVVQVLTGREFDRIKQRNRRGKGRRR